MHYINKRTIPKSFSKKIETLTKWSDYHDCCFKQKQALKRYILSCEQKYLCIYCESKIILNKDSSHIEHIKPKDEEKYPELTFDYNNLVVSCNGTCFNQVDDDIKYNCGHIKKNEYNEEKFLNPCEVIDLEAYFKYDFDDFNIYSTDKNIEKSEYMINTLKLNSGRLIIARRNTYKSFNKRIKKIKNILERNQYIINELQLEKLQFISFFRYKYKHLI